MTNHIENLQIETYRGIKNLQIENLGTVNVFVGDNNVGKTSVLEAIQLLCKPNAYNLVQIARQREKYKAIYRMGLSTLDAVEYMFNVKTCNKGTNNYFISVGGKIHNKVGKVNVTGKIVDQLIDLNEIAEHSPIARERIRNSMVELQEEVPTFIGSIESTFKINDSLVSFDELQTSFEINEYSRLIRRDDEDSMLNVKLVQTVDHIIVNSFNGLIKNKKVKEKAVELLKKFDETITDIRYINDDNRFVPIIENSAGDYIPLSLYGDGVKKALTILDGIIKAENGVLLIDEFETAFHTSTMNQIFKLSLEASKELNVQLFLTTHNIEAVDKLLESAENLVSDVRVIRLKKKEGKTFAKVLNGKDALEDRKEYNMELRI